MCHQYIKGTGIITFDRIMKKKGNITVPIGMARELAPSEILAADSTDYLLGGTLTMKNGRIDRYLFDEGYCQASKVPSNPAKDKFVFYYYDRDHLGSVRQVIIANGTDKGTVAQKMNYYPSGLQFCDGTTDGDKQLRRYNGKEYDKMHGLNTYDYGARQYNPVTARWDRVDPLCEKYYGMSPYAYCGNNPMNRIDPNGMYFDEVNDKKAKKYEKKTEKKATKLERKAQRRIRKGKQVGNLLERAGELRQSAQDIRDMRADTSIEYRFAKANDASNPAGKGNPVTEIVGVNGKGDPIIGMFAEPIMGSRLHEARHGGQIARGELNLDKSNYVVSHEIEAYRAQFSWKGSFNYYKKTSEEDVLNAIRDRTFYLNSHGTVHSFDEITIDFIKSLKDRDGKFIYNFE